MNGIKQTIIYKIKNFFYSIAVNYTFHLISKAMAKTKNPNERVNLNEGNQLGKDYFNDERDKKIDLSSSDQKKILDALIASTETMKKIKQGFGYSGQSTQIIR